MKKRIACVSGAEGQDGSHLCDLLLSKGYKVIAVVRKKSTDIGERIRHLKNHPRFILEKGDITDSVFLNNLFLEYPIDEFYNTAAQSHVGHSWKAPIQTLEVNILGVAKILEAIRQNSPKTKFLQCSSSEQFGKVKDVIQNEQSYMYPRSIYGISKLAAYWLTINYRESYNLFAVNSICFNHEGERRNIDFVTKKVTDGVARIKLGLAKELVLGNLEAKRDFGYAPEYVIGMWLMLQRDKPEDFVLATGETHTIREFVEEAFKCAGIKDWQKYVKQDQKFMRPAEVDLLIGDATKAKEKLGWTPKTKFKELVKKMVEYDIKRLQNDRT